jgi:hypothetical protein
MMSDSWEWEVTTRVSHEIEQRADDAQAEANQNDDHDERDATECHL